MTLMSGPKGNWPCLYLILLTYPLPPSIADVICEWSLRFGKRNYDDYEDVEAEEEDLAKRHALWKRFSRLQRSNDFLRDYSIQ